MKNLPGLKWPEHNMGFKYEEADYWSDYLIELPFVEVQKGNEYFVI